MKRRSFETWIVMGMLVAAVGGAYWLRASGQALPAPSQALPGRSSPIATASEHFVFHTPLRVEPAAGMEVAVFGMGCFWGVERMFWTVPGVVSTAAGYAGGATPNPTYEEVVTGRTGHAEVVRVVYDPRRVTYRELLRTFWEGHDPTQGMRQGNDVGTQYRSIAFANTPEQRRLFLASREAYQRALTARGFGTITTELRDAAPFYFAEDYHQQYLAKNPGGYCGHGGTGVSCPVGLF